MANITNITDAGAAPPVSGIDSNSILFLGAIVILLVIMFLLKRRRANRAKNTETINEISATGRIETEPTAVIQKKYPDLCRTLNDAQTQKQNLMVFMEDLTEEQSQITARQGEINILLGKGKTRINELGEVINQLQGLCSAVVTADTIVYQPPLVPVPVSQAQPDTHEPNISKENTENDKQSTTDSRISEATTPELTPTTERVFSHIKSNPSTAPKDIATAIGTNPGSVGKSVKTLLTLNLIAPDGQGYREVNQTSV